MNTLKNSRNFWQEFAAIRKHFSRGSKTGKFSGAVLLMEAPLKAGRNCTKWPLKPLL
jgi:hypothetical protein